MASPSSSNKSQRIRNIIIVVGVLLILLAVPFICIKTKSRRQFTTGVVMTDSSLKIEPEVSEAPPITILRKVYLTDYAPEVEQQKYPICYAYASVYTARTLLFNATHLIK